MRATWGIAALSLFLAACAMAPRLQVLPALTPVDAARPHFIYPAVQGTAASTPRAVM